jgi:tRNA G46 methylase TrmB
MKIYKFNDFKISEIASAKIENVSNLNPIKHISGRSNFKSFIYSFRILLNYFSGSLKREKRDIQDEYDLIWDIQNLEKQFKDLDSFFLNSTYKEHITEDSNISTPTWWLNSIFLTIIEDQIKKGTFQNIIEIGSGNGFNLIYLANRFPDKNFFGFELTKRGVENSYASSKNKVIVENISKFVSLDYNSKISFPLNNLTFTQKDITKGLDQSFVIGNTLVFTSLAMEQMEDIFPEAIKNILEIKADKYLFIEPLLDFQNFFDKLNLKNKGYLYRSSSEIMKKNFSSSLYFLFKKLRKKKFGLGMLILEKTL